MRLRALALVSLLAACVTIAAGLLALPGQAPPARAATGTGALTGQVLWCASVPVVYGTAAGSAESQHGVEAFPAPSLEPSPDGSSQIMPEGGVRPVPIMPRPIPAGAVLVAVQGTALSARTNESGRFRIEGVPAGQYLTIAAGPVSGVSSAVALRPNAFIPDGGQTINLGSLSLGQSCSRYGPLPYGTEGVAPETLPDGEMSP